MFWTTCSADDVTNALKTIRSSHFNKGDGKAETVGSYLASLNLGLNGRKIYIFFYVLEFY